MKKRKRISIKWSILLPVCILGIVAIVSNFEAIANLRSVNSTAVVIADEHMENISELSEIQRETQELHKLALSHIIATDLDTMIGLIESVQSEEEILDGYFEEYGDNLAAMDENAYNQILENYEGLKYEIANLLAYSGNDDKASAYALANGTIKEYSDAIQEQVTGMQSLARQSADTASDNLKSEYQRAFVINSVFSTICILALIAALYSVFVLVISKLNLANREIRAIIAGIDNNEGDLTKRISIRSNDEIADLGGGINTFMEKLQSIMKMIIENSRKLEAVVNNVQESVRTSNDSASDLSAMTQELSATMQEIGNSASIINNNADSVRAEVETIADKSGSINEYSKQMKSNADEMELNAKNTMQETSAKVQEILGVLNEAIEESKSVEQVNGLTNEILNISSQTNLLALNASIEAARAGEAGKGFAVVADEIRQLADSSRDTANRIQTINTMVTKAVRNLSDNANNLVEYMNASILPQFEGFVSSGAQYRENATYIESVMNEFAAMTDGLRKAVDDIAVSLETITSAIGEGADGVAGAAESTQALVSDMENISLRMDENHDIASALQHETDVFKSF